MGPACALWKLGQTEPNQHGARPADADELPNEKTRGDAKWQWLCQRCKRHASERDAGIGESENGQDAEGHPRVEAVFKLVQGSVALRVRRLQRHGESDCYSCQRCVNAGLQNEYPQNHADNHVWRDSRDFQQVQGDQHRDRHGREK